jgi:hypothetical protein
MGLTSPMSGVGNDAEGKYVYLTVRDQLKPHHIPPYPAVSVPLQPCQDFSRVRPSPKFRTANQTNNDNGC